MSFLFPKHTGLTCIMPGSSASASKGKYHIEYGNVILRELITLSNRFLLAESKEGQEMVAHDSIVKMLSVLHSIEISNIIPFAPKEFYRYGAQWPAFSHIAQNILSGHYRRACWAMEDMINCAIGYQEPYFYINQFRCLLEQWAGVEHMCIWQKFLGWDKKLAALQDEDIRHSYHYALSQLDLLVGDNDLDKIAIMMRMIKNDIKFSSIGNILRETPVCPQQTYCYIPAYSLSTINKLQVDSAHTDIVIHPYQTDKFAGAMTDLAHAPYNASINYHDGIYWPELNMAVMQNGIHHSSIGLARGEIVTMIAEVVPLTPWFDRLETDGVLWTIRGERGSWTKPVLDFRFALLFELAKRAHVASIDATQSKKTCKLPC